VPMVDPMRILTILRLLPGHARVRAGYWRQRGAAGSPLRRRRWQDRARLGDGLLRSGGVRSSDASAWFGRAAADRPRASCDSPGTVGRRRIARRNARRSDQSGIDPGVFMGCARSRRSRRRPEGLAPDHVTHQGAPQLGAGRSRSPRGSATQAPWEPDAADYRPFAQALATRYSGRFPDPCTRGGCARALRTSRRGTTEPLDIPGAGSWKLVQGHMGGRDVR